MTSVARRRAGAAATAAVLAAADLAHAALAPTPYHHLRSAPALLLMEAVAAALLWLAPRLPSTAAAMGAGAGAGGAIGNLVAALAWTEGVPDPLVAHRIAFNLADVSVLAGDAVMLSAAAIYALRNRAALRAPL